MTLYKDRLICFLDVLGYSAMVEKVGIEEIYTKYSSFVDIAKNKVFFGTPDTYKGPSNNFAFSEIFSDSIILISHDIRDATSVNNFIGAIHLFLELGLVNEFMFRGCVNQGDIIIDEERKIFLSKEFNEATKYESKIDVPVCVILDKARHTVISSLFGWKTCIRGVVPTKSLPIVKWSVPLKQGLEEALWCINYTFFCNKSQINAAIKYLAGDSPKQTNFVKYLAFIDSLPEEVLIPSLKNATFDHVKVIKSRSGMRVAFANELGEIQEPIKWGYPALFIEPPEEINILIGQNAEQVSFSAKGKWY